MFYTARAPRDKHFNILITQLRKMLIPYFQLLEYLIKVFSHSCYAKDYDHARSHACDTQIQTSLHCHFTIAMF